MKTNVRTIRMSEETWEEFKKAYNKSGFNWNTFILFLLGRIKKK